MPGSVAEAVRDRVMSDPCTSQCLARGIVNLSALARLLASEMEASGARVNIAAVKMALYRLAGRLRGDLVDRVRWILSRSAIVIHDSVTVITVPGSLMPEALAAAAELAGGSRFIQVTQGFKTATIVVSSEDSRWILERVGKPLEVIEGQTAIVIVSPREIIETPGVVSYLTWYLASNGVNITQIISCYVDTIIVVDSSNALKAFNLLHRLVGSGRSTTSTQPSR